MPQRLPGGQVISVGQMRFFGTDQALIVHRRIF